jgi:hypothetical protein
LFVIDATNSAQSKQQFMMLPTTNRKSRSFRNKPLFVSLPMDLQCNRLLRLLESASESKTNRHFRQRRKQAHHDRAQTELCSAPAMRSVQDKGWQRQSRPKPHPEQEKQLEPLRRNSDIRYFVSSNEYTCNTLDLRTNNGVASKRSRGLQIRVVGDASADSDGRVCARGNHNADAVDARNVILCKHISGAQFPIDYRMIDDWKQNDEVNAITQ